MRIARAMKVIFVAGLMLTAGIQAAENKIDGIRKVRADKLAVIEADASKKRQVVNDAYLKQLQELQTALTKAGDLEGALAVKKEIEIVDTEFARHGGHRYKLVNEACSWADAKKKCAAMGGYLVCVNSKEEWEFLLGILQSVPPGTMGMSWSGGSMTKKGVEFLDGSTLPWVDALKLVHWYQDPVKANKIAKYKLLLHTDGYHAGPGWDTWPETEKVIFFCEWDK